VLGLALGHAAAVPTVLAPTESAGRSGSAILAAGCGDNAAAALGVAARPGDVIVSVGTSGVVSAVSTEPTADASGIVAGFASATGDFLPLVCTLNAARVLDVTGRMIGVDREQLSTLALSAPSGADGLVLVPYLDGERTPNRPDSTGALHGLTATSSTPAHLARAAVEGLLCGLADGLDSLVAQGVAVEHIILIGGGARSRAVCELAPVVLGHTVSVPEPGEYVADGAARQAAWSLTGEAAPPSWRLAASQSHAADADPAVRARYARARDLTVPRGPAR
jgi:xylulokinase